MRMMKRVAVGILAAAMALTMMTGCGGGGSNKPANSGSTKPGTSQGSNNNNSNNSNKNDNKNDNDKKDNTYDNLNKLKDGSEVKYTDSMTYKVTQQVANVQTLYMNIEAYQPSNPAQKMTVEMARKGKNTYTKMVDTDGSVEEALVADTTTYELFRDKSTAVTTVYPKSDTSSSDSSASQPSDTNTKVKKTTHVVGKTTYYAESVTVTQTIEGHTIITTELLCYDKTGVLAYAIMEPGTQSETVLHFVKFNQSIPSTAIMSIPKDWEIYTAYYERDDKTGYVNLSKVTNRSGKKLTESEIEGVEKDLGTYL